MHNGTLKNHWDLLKKYELEYIDYNVDSDVIAGCIEKDNSFDVLKLINGPAALLIIDKTNPKTLYAFRNSERPLYKGFIDGNMYISSVKETLELINCNAIKEFKEDYLYVIEEGSVIKKIKVKNTPYEPPKTNGFTSITSYIRGKEIGCKIKARYLVTLHWKGNNIKVDPDKSYVIKKIFPSSFQVYDPIDRVEFNLSKHNADERYIIHPNDYVIATEDIYNRAAMESNEYFIDLQKGQIVKVNISYEDGDFSFTIKNKGHNLAYKSEFEKLVGSDLEQYLATLNDNLPANFTSPDNNSLNNSEISIIDNIEVDNQEEEEQPHGCETQGDFMAWMNREINEKVKENNYNAEIITNKVSTIKDELVLGIDFLELDNTLCEFFPQLEQALDELDSECRRNKVSDEIMKKLKKIITMNYSTYNSIYPIDHARGN